MPTSKDFSSQKYQEIGIVFRIKSSAISECNITSPLVTSQILREGRGVTTYQILPMLFVIRPRSGPFGRYEIVIFY